MWSPSSRWCSRNTTCGSPTARMRASASRSRRRSSSTTRTARRASAWGARTTNAHPATSPDARLGEQISAALFLNSPYGRPVIGWRHEIEKLTRADALAFYRRFYTPNNAVVVIAGDVTADQVKALAEKTYAKVPRVADIAPRARAQEPPPAAPRTVMLADPRVAQPSMERNYLVPSYAKARKDAAALEVLAHILGSGSTSRLYRALVVDQRVATN